MAQTLIAGLSSMGLDPSVLISAGNDYTCAAPRQMDSCVVLAATPETSATCRRIWAPVVAISTSGKAGIHTSAVRANGKLLCLPVASGGALSCLLLLVFWCWVPLESSQPKKGVLSRLW